MKEINPAYANRYQGEGSDTRSVTYSFGISIFLHLFIIGALIFIPEPTPRSRFSAGVVNVSLVSLPSKAPAAQAGGQTAVKPKQEVKKPPKAKISKIAPPPKKPVAQKPAKAVSLAPKPKKKTSLKKKTIDRRKVIESAIKQVQKKVDDSDSASVKAALDRLKKEVAETEASKAQTLQPSPATRESEGAGFGARTGTGSSRGSSGRS